MSKTITSEYQDWLLSLDQTAERLGLSIWTVRKWIQDGKIASNKLGGRRLVPLSEIQRLIEETRVPARAVAA